MRLVKWQKNREDGIKALEERQEVLAKAKQEEPRLIQELEAAKQALAQAQANALKAVNELKLGDFLASDKLDAQLTKYVVLFEATPRGLAEFAQQGKGHEQLVERLLADADLMLQMVVADGANGVKGRNKDLDFLAITQARGVEKAYMQVKRAQWVGDVLGEVRTFGFLWRLRALYALKNARGTKVLAIGKIDRKGGDYQKSIDVWGYQYEVVPLAEFAKRLEAARADQKVVEAVEQQTTNLLAQPNVKLMTERKFVFNTLLARRVAKELMKEVGATNIGISGCMGRGVITTLDTPPCLPFALLCDEGLTAYCHVWPVHTVPGVLLRWIGRVCS